MTSTTAPDETDAAVARLQVWAFTLLLTVVCAGLYLLIPDASEPLVDVGLWPALAVAVAFFAAEPLVFHIEARNEAVSFSPTELPLAFGLLFLAPHELVIARLLAAALALVIVRRQPPFKFSFNLSFYAAETLVAYAVLRTFAPDETTLTPLLWATLSIALLTALIVGGFAVAYAISRFEHDLGDRVRSEAHHIVLFHAPQAFIAATLLVPAVQAPWFGAVAMLPMIAVWLILRSHGSLMHRYTDLSEMHAFSHQVGVSTQIEDILETAVAEVGHNLRAGRVAVVMWDDSPGVVLAAAGDHGMVSALSGPEPHDSWADGLASDSALTVHPMRDSSAGAARLAEVGAQEVILFGLSDDAGPLGLLAIADRGGSAHHFSADDVDRLVTIGQQLSVVLGKARLYVRVQHQATHDRLTGLANRVLFEAHAEQAIGPDAVVSMLQIDLDRFKQVNDTLGHAAGDELLIQVAQRLGDRLEPVGLFARFGGDEFAVLLPDHDAESAERIARSIVHMMELPFSILGTSVGVGASIGVAAAPEDGTDAETLLRRADLAMYDAKRERRGVRRFASTMDDPEDAARLTLLADLRAAIRRRAIAVHYQPKVDLATGKVLSVEALARWHDPDRGTVRPDEFIGLAENSGLIGPLTDHILDTVLGDVAYWRSLGLHLDAAVNVSAQSLADETLPELLAERLRERDVPASALTVEITETAMMHDVDRAALTVGEVGKMGVGVSIDDFGTGFSSLVSLRRLPITELKIDRSFVADMLTDDSDLAIVRSTIDLGHALGLQVVAEGVETEEIMAALAELGCHVAQGFGIARPMAASELLPWLEARDGTLARR
ncbi:MAG: EAL domain-containing protein [Actinomycetota bacterium]